MSREAVNVATIRKNRIVAILSLVLEGGGWNVRQLDSTESDPRS